jgi:exosome complex component RRP4
MEDMVSSAMYSSQNDEISLATRREIARLAGCIRVLVEGGVRIDEENVMKAYEKSLELDLEIGDEDDTQSGREGRDYLGGDRASRITFFRSMYEMATTGSMQVTRLMICISLVGRTNL